MKDEAIGKVLAGLEAKPYRGRSGLYRWLRANYRRLSRKMAERQPSWAAIAQEITAVGVTNTKGQPPSEDSVRRVWATVCRDVLAAAEAKAEAAERVGHKFPSRISPDWRPTVVVPPPTSRSPPPRLALPAPATGGPAMGDSGRLLSPAEVDAEIAKAKAKLDEIDRKAFGFPR